MQINMFLAAVQSVTHSRQQSSRPITVSVNKISRQSECIPNVSSVFTSHSITCMHSTAYTEQRGLAIMAITLWDNLTHHSHFAVCGTNCFLPFTHHYLTLQIFNIQFHAIFTICTQKVLILKFKRSLAHFIQLR